MKCLINFFVLVFVVAVFSTDLFAQLKIGEGGNLGVDVNPHPTRQVFIKNRDLSATLYVQSEQNSSSTRTGLFNYMIGRSGGIRRAFYNRFFDEPSFESSNASAFAIQNILSVKNRDLSYGIFNAVYNKNTVSTDNIYGVYSTISKDASISNPPGFARAYGIYSKVDDSNPGNLAGYFHGDVSIQWSATI